MRTLGILLIGAMLAAGCVSSGKYAKLEQKHADTTSELTAEIEARERRIAELEEAVRAKDAEYQAAVQAHEEAIRAKDAELEESRALVATLRTEKSQLEAVLSTTIRDKARLKGKKSKGK